MSVDTPSVARIGVGGRVRSGLLTGILLLPATLWYLILLVAPLAIVVIFSFGTRAKNGGYTPGFVFDNYVRAIEKSDPLITSLQMAIAGDRSDACSSGCRSRTSWRLAPVVARAS